MDALAWAASQIGPVTASTPIGSGASRRIWRLDTDGPSYVVREDTGDGPVAGTVLNLEREATVYRALEGSGLPIPRLIGVSPDGMALLMDHAVGSEALAAVSDETARSAIADDYLSWLGRLHQVDVSTLALDGIAVPSSGADHALADLDMWMGIAASRTRGWETPSVPFAADWLRAHAPASPTATSLCHGDAGPGNFLFEGDRVTALLDWEFAHVGDPLDDIAWVSVRNHLLGQPMDMRRVAAAWSSTTGWTVDAASVAYYRVFVLLRMAISCDASLAWRDGVEDDAIRTQVLLRPWLGTAIAAALGFAGGTPGLNRVCAEAQDRLEASPHAEILKLIPPLEPLPFP